MKDILSKAIPSFVAITLLLLTGPLSVAANTNVSIVDIRGFNEGGGGLHFPGSSSITFRPLVAIVSTGDEVLFVNNGWEPHTVTSYTLKEEMCEGDVCVHFPVPDDVFDSGFPPISSGQSWTLQTGSLSAGDYKYFCQIHPWMQALLKVVSDETQGGAVVNIDHHVGGSLEHASLFFSASAAWTFLPTALAVKQGIVVDFTHDGLIPHTVTSYTIKVPVEAEGRTIMIPVEDEVFDSDFIPPGGTFAVDTGDLAKGRYTYFCEFHPWMQASLKVV